MMRTKDGPKTYRCFMCERGPLMSFLEAKKLDRQPFFGFVWSHKETCSDWPYLGKGRYAVRLCSSCWKDLDPIRIANTLNRMLSKRSVDGERITHV